MDPSARNFAAAFVELLRDPAVRAELRQIIREATAESRPRPDQDEATLLNTKQAAELLSMSPAAVRKAAERGKLPCLRLGRSLRFRRDELLSAVRR